MLLAQHLTHTVLRSCPSCKRKRTRSKSTSCVRTSSHTKKPTSCRSAWRPPPPPQPRHRPNPSTTRHTCCIPIARQRVAHCQFAFASAPRGKCGCRRLQRARRAGLSLSGKLFKLTELSPLSSRICPMPSPRLAPFALSCPAPHLGPGSAAPPRAPGVALP